MSQIPLPVGFEGNLKLPKTRTDLRGCFNTLEGEILPMPGIEGLALFDTPARGSFRWLNFFYGVWGDELYKLTDPATGAVSLIGTIAGSERIVVDTGFNEAVIVVKGSFTYTLDVSDVLTDISAFANIEPNIDVAQIDGIFVYIPADGSPAYFSDPGDASSVQPLSFFSAEELPDQNNGVINISNTLFITGTDSIELFRNVGTTPNPFQRVSGSRQNYGLIAGKQEYTNVFLYIGREKDQDFGVYATGVGQSVKISNSAIDDLLRGYTLAEMQEVVQGRIKWRGYDIATFTLARNTFGFLKGKWFSLDTVIEGISRKWDGGFITEVDTFYFTASGVNLGRFEEIDSDFGNRISRIIDVGFDHPNNKRFSCQSVELGISQGFNDEEVSIAIMMSRDNVIYGPAIYKKLGKKGHYADKLVWNPPGGLGNYNGFMGIRIYTTQSVHFSADKFFANVR